MGIKECIILLSGFVASSLLIMILLKKLNPAFGNLGSKTWWINLLYGLGSSVLAFCITFLSKNNVIVFIGLGVIALLLGIGFYFLTHKKFFKTKAHNYVAQSVSELFYYFSVLNIMIAGFVGAVFYFVQKDFLFFPIAGALLLFLVPILIYKTYGMLQQVPMPIYPYWEYSIDNAIQLTDESDQDEVLVLAFHLIKTTAPTDSYTTFRTKAPVDMVLGDLFYHFINEYNEVQSETPISYSDEHLQAYKWYFYKQGKGVRFSRVLEPKLSIAQNKLKEDDVIVCDRILNN